MDGARKSLTYYLIFSNIRPPKIRHIPTIFTAVKTSLKIKKDAAKINTYTSAVDIGIIYPKSFFDIKYA